MKVLLIGGGGREHAIATELVKSPLVSELLCAPGNGGIRSIARTFPSIAAKDLTAIVELAKEEKVDFVVVAPDDPLALGLVDDLEANGIPAFGPTAAAARIEGSKVFSKALMVKYGIPTAKYQSFDDVEKALAFVDEQGGPLVVKADGLALGKGVIMAKTTQEARQAVLDMMQGGLFGKSGANVVIEEWMTGPEVTQLAFVDGNTIKLMPSSQDHKRAFDGDQGPNTGGMGAIAPSPHFTPQFRDQAMEEIFKPTLAALQEEGCPFKGVLYFGLMLTPDGPKVIEYNARFGDPETQAVLPLLKSDLMEVFIACREERLDQIDIVWSDEACACVVIASGGYPGEYSVGYPIEGLDMVEEGGAIAYHAGTREGVGAMDGAIVTSGGRVLGISALGEDLPEAIEQAYLAASTISFTGLHMRRDIGKYEKT